MSAIFAVTRWSASIDLQSSAQHMQEALGMYGHPFQTSYSDRHTVLGGTLHSFLPEDRFDAQPVTIEEGHEGPCTLVADVRLDNREDLLRRLALTDPGNLADSSLLALAWQRWGADCLQYLVGVFAFAVWNPAKRELFACRDQVGERPLFFHRAPGFFVLASMPKGLLALPEVDHGVDEDTVLHALTLSRYPQSVSFFKGIERVPPGHWLRVTPDSFELRAYWRPFEAPPVRFKRNEEYAEAFLEIFDTATAARLRSSHPIGSQLSSGLDSSSVTASAARALAARGQGLTTFTAVPRPGFAGTGFHGRLPDEGPGAADVARLYPNVEHVLLDSAAIDMVPTISSLSDAADEPVQNCVNGLWLAAILESARARGIQVMLQGVRGNLTFSHKGMEALGAMFRTGQWLKLARTAHSFRRRGFVSARESLAAATVGLLPRILQLWLERAGAFDLTYSAVNPQLATANSLHQHMLDEFHRNLLSPTAERLHLWHLYDMDTYSAAYQANHGIDVRDPCADLRVLEFCFAVPSEQYVAEGVPRSLARRSQRERLPESTLNRTVRGQQAADWYLTVRDALPDLAGQLALNEHSPLAARMLDLPRMRTLLRTFPTDQRTSLDASFAWADALCRGFSFGYFLRRHER